MEITIPEPLRVTRPWGDYLEFTRNTPTTVKILTVKAGESTSLQRHANRDEFWHILSGNGTVTIGEKILDAKTGDEFKSPRNANHRIAGGTEPLVLLEIAYGNADENDIVRIEDRYGRTNSGDKSS